MQSYHKILIPAAMAVIISTSLMSCRRDPILTRDDKLEIRFNFDLSENDPAMHRKPVKPSLLTVGFYNPEDGRIVRTCHFNAEGGKILGLEPGTYDILCYNANTEYTQVMFPENYNDALACTYELTSPADSLGTVIREPDHLLVGRLPGYTIPYLSTDDETHIITADMSTILDSYYLQVDSLKGLENINSVEVYLLGHSRDNRLSSDIRGKDEVTLYIPCKVDFDRYCLCATFCTFGKIPGSVGKAYLHIVVTGAGGRTYDFEDDITEQYNDPSHILKLCFHGEIKPREQSGFDPQVDDWDDDITNINLY